MDAAPELFHPPVYDSCHELIAEVGEPSDNCEEGRRETFSIVEERTLQNVRRRISAKHPLAALSATELSNLYRWNNLGRQAWDWIRNARNLAAVYCPPATQLRTHSKEQVALFTLRIGGIHKIAPDSYEVKWALRHLQPLAERIGGPTLVQAYTYYGLYYIVKGQPETGRKWLEKADQEEAELTFCPPWASMNLADAWLHLLSCCPDGDERKRRFEKLLPPAVKYGSAYHIGRSQSWIANHPELPQAPASAAEEEQPHVSGFLTDIYACAELDECFIR